MDFIQGKIVVTPNLVDRTKIKTAAQSAVDVAMNGKYIDQLISVKAVGQNGTVLWRVTGLLGAKLVKVYVNAETGALSGIE